jgi:RHS repeat-associated protein
VHHDVQGSTVALTTAGTSGPAETYTYSDYGAPQSGSWSAYQYAGYRYDSETGLYYVKARYYSPNLGRFLQTDPVGFQGGFNLYAYVGNDPINFTDPTGRFMEQPNVDMSIPYEQTQNMPLTSYDPTVPTSMELIRAPQVFTSQSPLVNGPYQFAGTEYDYQVVNAGGRQFLSQWLLKSHSPISL